MDGWSPNAVEIWITGPNIIHLDPGFPISDTALNSIAATLAAEFPGGPVSVEDLYRTNGQSQVTVTSSGPE